MLQERIKCVVLSFFNHFMAQIALITFPKQSCIFLFLAERTDTILKRHISYVGVSWQAQICLITWEDIYLRSYSIMEHWLKFIIHMKRCDFDRLFKRAPLKLFSVLPFSFYTQFFPIHHSTFKMISADLTRILTLGAHWAEALEAVIMAQTIWALPLACCACFHFLWHFYLIYYKVLI